MDDQQKRFGEKFAEQVRAQMERSELRQALFAGPRDFSEDYSLENGQYQNSCVYCGQSFTGHKRRVKCKACSCLTHAEQVRIRIERLWPIMPLSQAWKRPAVFIKQLIARWEKKVIHGPYPNFVHQFETQTQWRETKFTITDAELRAHFKELPFVPRAPNRWLHPFKYRRYARIKQQAEETMRAHAKAIADKVDADLAESFIQGNAKPFAFPRPTPMPTIITPAALQETLRDLDRYALPFGEFDYTRRPLHWFRAGEHTLPFTPSSDAITPETQAHCFGATEANDRRDRSVDAEPERCEADGSIGRDEKSVEAQDDSARCVEQSAVYESCESPSSVDAVPQSD